MKRLGIVFLFSLFFSSILFALWMPTGIQQGETVRKDQGGDAIVPRHLLPKLPSLWSPGEFQQTNPSQQVSTPTPNPTGVNWSDGVPEGDAQHVLSENFTYCERAAYLHTLLTDVQEGYQSNVVRPLFFLTFAQTRGQNDVRTMLGGRGLLTLSFAEAKGYGLTVDDDVEDERLDPWRVMYALADSFEQEAEEGWSEELIVAAFYKGANMVRTCLHVVEPIEDGLSLDASELFRLCAVLLPEGDRVRDLALDYPKVDAFYSESVERISQELTGSCIIP